jgi:ketosteroid isomerase-like protein
MDEGLILETIGRFWAVRIKGDKAQLRSFLAGDAIYEMIGASSFADKMQVGPTPAGPAIDLLIDDFKFNGVERVGAIVEGRKAAVVNRLEVSFRGGAPVTTEACDIWEFDDAGKVKSLRQFVDTALVKSMIAGR